HLTGCVPANRALVAIQPQAVDWGHSLSNPVKQALPGAGKHMLALLSEWHCALPGIDTCASAVAANLAT
ncbi:MAG: hypothetical protein OEX75_11060, partial [Gammaproteobacteria bacterium]|nr:hypothetical protein [Gammaproteobacteria bacterium]